jgi:hypothetical protein
MQFADLNNHPDQSLSFVPVFLIKMELPGQRKLQNSEDLKGYRVIRFFSSLAPYAYENLFAI